MRDGLADPGQPGPPAVAVVVAGAGVGEHGTQQCQRRRRFVVEAAAQHREQRFGGLAGRQFGGIDRDGPREELFLIAEVVHHQAGIDPGRGGDGANGGVVVTQFGEGLPGRGEDALLGVDALLSARTGVPGPRRAGGVLTGTTSTRSRS
nr:hypothetical protein [Nonomuraea fuscirosea]